jgi:hypothetical protein
MGPQYGVDGSAGVAADLDTGEEDTLGLEALDGRWFSRGHSQLRPFRYAIRTADTRLSEYMGAMELEMQALISLRRCQPNRHPIRG